MTRKMVTIHFIIFAGGLLFGFGLGLSRMVQPEVVLDFLQLEDLGLIFVMGGAAVISGLVFNIAARRRGKAFLTGIPYKLRRRDMNRDIVVGGVIFGAGWGLSGVCPGGAYASLGVGNIPILFALAGMFLGAYLYGRWQARAARQAESFVEVKQSI